jgi:hypothetical protein
VSPNSTIPNAKIFYFRGLLGGFQGEAGFVAEHGGEGAVGADNGADDVVAGGEDEEVFDRFGGREVGLEIGEVGG